MKKPQKTAPLAPVLHWIARNSANFVFNLAEPFPALGLFMLLSHTFTSLNQSWIAYFNIHHIVRRKGVIAKLIQCLNLKQPLFIYYCEYIFRISFHNGEEKRPSGKRKLYISQNIPV